MRLRMLVALSAGSLLIAAACGADPNVDERADATESATAGSSTVGDHGGLRADFSWEFERDLTRPTSCPVVATALTDLSEGQPETWLWTFPDETTSDVQNPTVDAYVEGTVTLTVTAGEESSSIDKNVISEIVC